MTALAQTPLDIPATGERTPQRRQLPRGFTARYWPAWGRRGMPDLLYKTSIYGPLQEIRELPWRPWRLWGGDAVAARRAEVTYHFYNVDQDINAPMRTSRALDRIKRSGELLIELKGEQKDKIVSSILLGLLPDTNAKQVIEKGNVESLIAAAVNDGRLDASIPELLAHDYLPFRESPLSGKTITEIVKNPTALAVFVVVGTQGNPVVIAVLPVGIIGIHVAFKVRDHLGRWVDKKLKQWLK